MADEVLSSRSRDPEPVEDELLSQATPEDPVEGEDPDLVGVDITGDVEPGTVDIGKVAAGWRPARRAVTLRNNDLRYLTDELREQIDAKRAAGLDTKDDEARLAHHMKTFIDSGVTLVFGGRSSEWVKELESALKADGIDPVGLSKRIEKIRKTHNTKIDAATKKDMSASTIEALETKRDAELEPLIEQLQEQYRTYAYHRVAAQITNAPGATGDHIRDIAEADEPAFEALWSTMEAANKDRRVARDFSRQPSGPRRNG